MMRAHRHKDADAVAIKNKKSANRSGVQPPPPDDRSNFFSGTYRDNQAKKGVQNAPVITQETHEEERADD